jgi:ATP synthase protein I
MLKVLVAQVGIGAVLTAVFWGLDGTVAGYSALLGSLTCVLPNAFLALRLAVPRRDSGARALIRAAWVGEIGKLGLTVLMFSVVFLLVKPLSVAALFAGFIATQLMTFAGLLLRDKETEETNE